MEDSSEDDDSFCEQLLSPKNIAIRKIEFIFADFKEQMERRETKPILRASFDKSHFTLKYQITGENNKQLKLKRDLFCLDQIYNLLLNDKKSTKREMYYENKDLYKTQSVLDRCIQQICELLDESRQNLNVISCSKGILRGAITFISTETGLIDARVQNVLISEELLECQILSDAQFILVVEKDAAFQKLLDDQFESIFPKAIITTGKGYPDICTRNVLNHIVQNQSIPIFGLFDADPHGIEIFLTYKYGSTTDRAEGRGAYIPNIKWIGLFPSDSQRFPILRNQFLDLSSSDFTKLQTLFSRSIQLNEYLITSELNFLLENRFKLEIEAMNTTGHQILSRAIIGPRIQHLLNNSSL